MPLNRRRYTGLFFDAFALDSAWLRESGTLRLPSFTQACEVVIEGEFRAHEQGGVFPTLLVFRGSEQVALVARSNSGPWSVKLGLTKEEAQVGVTLAFKLKGVGFSNFLAWAGRVFEKLPGGRLLQGFRAQNRNRQIRIKRVLVDGRLVFDFANRHAPFSPTLARASTKIGVNVVGFLTADLGIGESARCMLRSAQAAGIPVAANELLIPCKATRTDATYKALLQTENPHPVNVFHIDPPGALEIPTHHGAAFKKGRHNIGYWAWELPDFPDAWMPYFSCVNEVWCPSEFVREAIAEKSPVPVVTMPHSISFQRPVDSTLQLRTRLGLPADRYLFLFLYDLNSYSERKNPRAVIEAFRLSGLSGQNASLVIKVHGAKTNEKDLAELRALVDDLPGTVLITETYSRTAIYELEAACDCFVSLHRSEGFGLAVAECMFLGKPVISTDWSATKEFVDETNGCPVRSKLVALEHSHGPYAKGQFWADPDLGHAAEWMKRLYEDPQLGAILGTSARSTIESRFSPAAIGAKMRRRLETIGAWQD